MNKKISLLCLSLSIFLVVSCVSKNKYVELENQSNSTRERLERDISDLRAEIAQLDNENRRLKDTIAALETDVIQKEKEVSELDKTRMEIETSLKEQIAQKNIKLEEIEGKLKVTFVDKILFDSGSVTIKPEGQEVILKLADSFRDTEDNNIAVEGHTDNVQIGGALIDRFPTNWELSTARATAVVRFLEEKGNIAPERLTASGFSYHRSVATNDTPEGRKENRRIEIILVPIR